MADAANGDDDVLWTQTFSRKMNEGSRPIRAKRDHGSVPSDLIRAIPNNTALGPLAR